MQKVRWILMLPGIVWLLLLMVVPCALVLVISFYERGIYGGIDWIFTLENFQRAADPLYLRILGVSVSIAGIATLICILIGYPCALVLARTIKGRARETLFLLVILPFWSNSLVRIFSWAIVLRGNGVLERTIEAILPWDIRLDLMFTPSAVVIGLVHSYLPYVILTSYLALQAIDDDIVDAARSMGASSLTILRRLLLPLSLPGLLAGAVLVFVPVVGSFMEPRILGGRYGTYYGTVIEDQFVAVYNWPLGAALSFVLLAVVLVILGLASPILRKAKT